MTSAEFCDIESVLGLSSPAMAEALGVDVRRVRTFEEGSSEVPRVVALAAWALWMRPLVAEATKLLHGMKGE